MAELTATVDQQPNQTTIRISGYLSADHAESLETAFAELDSKKVLLDFDEKCFISVRRWASVRSRTLSRHFLLPPNSGE